ncbi:MAG: nitronate monooxygenase [Clostridiales bacterium]|nr:nitronate monooxygenase [Clostridiales bacterium]
MNLPQLKIGNLITKYPIVQGGMGVGISLSSLAGNVSLNGGIGVISGVEIGFKEPDYYKNKIEANLRALKKHIQEAKKISNDGIIGVNIMVAVNNFEEYVKTAVQAKADIIFSGAGLPLSLPKLTMGSQTKIAPIVSSARSANIICKNWDKKFNMIPDAIVVEGPLAGGHLGYSKEVLLEGKITLEDILVEVLEVIKPFQEKYKKLIPVIAGGGIYKGEQIANLLKLGASGVQIGSRFVATEECDASDAFKQAFVDAKKDDIRVIQSPVGMPGRAIGNKFLDEVEAGNKKPISCFANCLRPCVPSEAPYCIANALINAEKGNFNSGYAFAGANAYRIDRISTVKEVIDELVIEAEKFY